jgi:biopolymer transport protein ExbD
MKLLRAKKIDAYIPSASMADIAFLLITFFMVTSSFPMDRSTLLLPLTEMRFQVDDSTAAWIVAYKDGDQVFLKVSDGSSLSAPLEKNNPFPIDRLDAWIYDQINKNPTKLFLLKVDKSISYYYVDKIYTAIKNTSAVKNIVFLSQAKSKEG